jgi:hypothetical protein
MTLRGTICALGKQIGVGKEAGTNVSVLLFSKRLSRFSFKKLFVMELMLCTMFNSLSEKNLLLSVI